MPTELTIDDAIARLDESYDLVYVDYRDQLTDEQVTFLVKGDTEALYDSLDEWFSEAEYLGAEAAMHDAFDDDELDCLGQTGVQTIRETIMERDTSDWLSALIRQTPDPLLRVCVIDEDDAFAFESVNAREVLDKVGLSHSDHNVAAVEQALAECSPEYSVLLGYWVFSADLTALSKLEEDQVVRVANPHLYLGNPMAGSGFVTEPVLHGVVAIPRSELRTDDDAFGYSIASIYGGVRTSEYHSEIDTHDSHAMSVPSL